MATTRPSCGLTVLRTTGFARATKRWRWNLTLREWVKTSYTAGARFTAEERHVTSLADLVAVLACLSQDPRAFIVRGALSHAAHDEIAGDPGRTIRRRKHLKNNIAPTLEEVPRRWIMIDIDNWPLPSWGDLADDPDTVIEHAVHELLPEPFHDADCWWQLSSSAGFAVGMLKAHLFFWLSEPASNEHIKDVLKQVAPSVDRSPFSAAQPHFIADPIIVGGHDPLPRRTGWRYGLTDEVVLPEMPNIRRKQRLVGTGYAGRGGSIADALALVGDGEGLDGFHLPLRTAIVRYARQCSRIDVRDDNGIKAELRNAIRAAPRRANRDVETYLADYYLQASIDGAIALLAGDDEIQKIRPHHHAPTQTLEQARAALTQHVGGFFDRALAWNTDRSAAAEHAALIVGVGTGKSTAARAALPAFIEAAKAAGHAHRVLWLVPTHRLGDESLAEMRRLGINAVVMRGRGANIPGSIGPEPQKMCMNLPAVEDALSIHMKVEQSVCGMPDGPSCPWRSGSDQCAFQRQKAPVARADVVIAAHQTMFFELSKEVRDGLAAVVVDEAWWQVGLHPKREVFLSSFTSEPISHPVLDRSKSERSSWYQTINVFDTNDLHAISSKAQQAFEATPEGELLNKASVEQAGLTAKECASAYALEWRRMFEGAIYPGQPAQDRKAAVAKAAGNASIPRRAGIWRALQALLEGDEFNTGRLQMDSRSSVEGTLRTIALHSRLDICDDVSGVPMLHLDATMAVSIVKHFLPRLTVLAEINPVAPHMRVHQIIGGWGKTSIVSSEKTWDSENKRRGSVVSALVDFVALHSGDNALVVTYEAIEAEFQMPGVRTAHFNAISGLDAFRDVRSLFVIGRPLPDARDLHLQALALTGRAIAAELGHVETRGTLIADGTGAAVNVRVFNDPDLEALRTAITEREIIQAVGRGRGVNRDATRPLNVFVLADAALPIPVTKVIRWADIRPDVVRRMAARHGVLWSATDAARGYPDLFATPDAARMAIARTL